MLRAGACGYVPKRAAPHLLLTAIRAAAKGDLFLHPCVVSSLVQTCLARGCPGARGAASDGLTTRQAEVLTLVAEGLSNRQICERLGISVHTVQRHRANIRRQLQLGSGADLKEYALRKGLIQLDEAL